LKEEVRDLRGICSLLQLSVLFCGVESQEQKNEDCCSTYAFS